MSKRRPQLRDRKFRVRVAARDVSDPAAFLDQIRHVLRAVEYDCSANDVDLDIEFNESDQDTLQSPSGLPDEQLETRANDELKSFLEQLDDAESSKSIADNVRDRQAAESQLTNFLADLWSHGWRVAVTEFLKKAISAGGD